MSVDQGRATERVTRAGERMAAIRAEVGRVIVGKEYMVSRLLIGLVGTYAGVLIVLPLVGLIRGAFAEGVGGAIKALRQPGVLGALSEQGRRRPGRQASPRRHLRGHLHPGLGAESGHDRRQRPGS